MNKMEKGIILYQSKYGATEKYAKWLQEKTGFALMETKKATLGDVLACDTVILGGGVYAGGIAGLNFLKKHMDKLMEKKMLVFAVGASPYDERFIDQCKDMHFKDELAHLPLFYCRGAWDMEKMTFLHRKLCTMLKKAVAKQDPATFEPWQMALFEVGEEACDWTDERYLAPILEELKK